MRPVNKGNAPNTYSNYQNARNDLFDKVGWYCSYCEMPINHMAQVEHVIPRNLGGAVVDWDNLLLACVHCNSPKSNINLTRRGYFWPDRDNTFRAFHYQNNIPPIKPHTNLKRRQKNYAQSLINLCGLDRIPGSSNPPTPRDVRWRCRHEAWNIAIRALNNWKNCRTPQMMETIADLAVQTGFFSIWMEIFDNEKHVRAKLIEAFPGTARDCFDNNILPIKRIKGLI